MLTTLRPLEVAVALAEEGGCTATARRGTTMQSALSHRVATIGQALGARLFERGPRRVRGSSLHGLGPDIPASASPIHQHTVQAC